MIYAGLLAGILALLIGVGFVTKRRFGVLVLALLAGELFTRLWVGDLTPIVAQTGVVVTRPPLSSVVALVLMLTPALLLLFSGPTSYKAHHRILGAVIFGVMAVALCQGYIYDALVPDALAKTIHQTLVTFRPYILTTCTILALGDMLAIHSRKLDKRHK